MIMINSGREWDWMDKKTKKMKNELIEFLDWLSEEGICRWYSIEKEYGGEGESDIVERYLKEKDEVGKSGKVQ